VLVRVRGFSLIEVMIAGAMFAVGTAGIVSGWFMLFSGAPTRVSSPKTSWRR
jgi:prepilin-type N-terminal cleavage/methylation domain-containing protein